MITFTSRLLDGSLSGVGEPDELSRGNTDDEASVTLQSPDRTPSNASFDTFPRELITV